MYGCTMNVSDGDWQVDLCNSVFAMLLQENEWMA